MKYLGLSVAAVLLAAALWHGSAHHHAAPVNNRVPATVEELKRRPDVPFTVEAGEFLIGLAKNGKLPGFSASDHGRMQAGAPEAASESYPVTRAVHFSKDGDTSDYFYVVVRDSEGAQWRLLKAARMSSNGQIIQEYGVP